MEKEPNKHLVQSKDIVGFDFEKRIMLTDIRMSTWDQKAGRYERVYGVDSITDEEIEIIRDAFLDYRLREAEGRSLWPRTWPRT